MDSTVEPMEVDEWDPSSVETNCENNGATSKEKCNADFAESSTISQRILVDKSDGYTASLDEPQTVTEDSDIKEIVLPVEKDSEAIKDPAIVEVAQDVDVDVVSCVDDKVETMESDVNDVTDNIEVVKSTEDDVDVVETADENAEISSPSDSVGAVETAGTAAQANGENIKDLVNADSVNVGEVGDDNDDNVEKADDNDDNGEKADDNDDNVEKADDNVKKASDNDNNVETTGDNDDNVKKAGDNDDNVEKAGDDDDNVKKAGDNDDNVKKADDNDDNAEKAGDNVDNVKKAGDNDDNVKKAGDNDDNVEKADDNADNVEKAGDNDDNVEKAGDNDDNVEKAGDNDDNVEKAVDNDDNAEKADDNADSDVVIVESADKDLEITGYSNGAQSTAVQGPIINLPPGVVMLYVVNNAAANSGAKCCNFQTDPSGAINHEETCSAHSVKQCNDCKKVMSKKEYENHSATCEMKYKSLWDRCRDLSPARDDMFDHGLRGTWSKTWRESVIRVEYKKIKFVTKIGDNFYKLEVPGMAKCILCQKQIWYGGRGKRALVDHIKGMEHLKRMTDYYVKGSTARRQIDENIEKLTSAIVKTRGIGSLKDGRGKLFDCIHCGMPFSSSIIALHESRCVDEREKTLQFKKKAFGLKQLLVVDDESADPSEMENRIKELSMFLTDEENAYICVICKTGFKREARSHFLEHCKQHKNQKYTCKICSQTFCVARRYQRHTLHHALANAKGCHVCGQPIWHLRNARNTIYWLVKKHDCIYEQPEPGKSDQPLKCKLCNGKELKTQSAAVMHAYLHVASSPFPCDRCDRKFATRTDRILHKNEEHGMQYSSGHRCKLCLATFNSVGRLRAHDEVCTDMMTTYHCELCNVTYRSSNYLSKHIRTAHSKRTQGNDAKRRRLDTIKILSKPAIEDNTLDASKQKPAAFDKQLLELYKKMGIKLLTCPLCNTFHTGDIDALKAHLTDRHIGRETVEALGANAFKQCFFCNRWCANFPNLISHMRAAHSSGVVHTTETNDSLCLICHERTESIYLHVKEKHLNRENQTSKTSNHEDKNEDSNSHSTSLCNRGRTLCCPFCHTCMREYEAMKKHITEVHVGEDVTEKLGDRAFKVCLFCPVNCRNLSNWLHHLLRSHQDVNLSQMKFDGLYFKDIQSTNSDDVAEIPDPTPGETALRQALIDRTEMKLRKFLQQELPKTCPSQTDNADDDVELISVNQPGAPTLILEISDDESAPDSVTVVTQENEKVSVGSEQFEGSRPTNGATSVSPSSHPENDVSIVAAIGDRETRKTIDAPSENASQPEDSMDVDQEQCESGDAVQQDSASSNNEVNPGNMGLAQLLDMEEESVPDSVTLINQKNDDVSAGSELPGDTKPTDAPMSQSRTSQPADTTCASADNGHERGRDDTSMVNASQTEDSMDVDQKLSGSGDPNIIDIVQQDNASSNTEVNPENIGLTQRLDMEEGSVPDSVALITQEKDEVSGGNELPGETTSTDDPMSQSADTINADDDIERGTDGTSMENTSQPENKMEVDQVLCHNEVNLNKESDVQEDSASSNEKNIPEKEYLSQQQAENHASLSSDTLQQDNIESLENAEEDN